MSLLAALGGGTAAPGCTYAYAEVPQVSIAMAADYPGQVAGLVYGRDTFGSPAAFDMLLLAEDRSRRLGGSPAA